MPKPSLKNILLLTTLLLAACQPISPAVLPTLTAPPTQAASATWTLVPMETATLPPTPTSTPAPLAKRVLILSLDGLRADAVAQAPMPNLLALMQAGAYSLNAQTIIPAGTLPAHTSMLTGLCPSKHGVDWNDYLPERGYAKGPSLFDLAHAAGLETDMVVGKQKLVQVTDPASLDNFTFINDRDVVITQKLLENFPENFGSFSFTSPPRMTWAAPTAGPPGNIGMSFARPMVPWQKYSKLWTTAACGTTLLSL